MKMTDDELDDLRAEGWIDRIAVGHLLDRLKRTETDLANLREAAKLHTLDHNGGCNLCQALSEFPDET